MSQGQLPDRVRVTITRQQAGVLRDIYVSLAGKSAWYWLRHLRTLVEKVNKALAIIEQIIYQAPPDFPLSPAA